MLTPNAPDGVDEDSWVRLVVARRQKIESEQRLKNQALDLAGNTGVPSGAY